MFSHTSSESTTIKRETSSIASVKFEADPLEDSMEYDLPTDTDDSSMESPTDCEFGQ